MWGTGRRAHTHCNAKTRAAKASRDATHWTGRRDALVAKENRRFDVSCCPTATRPDKTGLTVCRYSQIRVAGLRFECPLTGIHSERAPRSTQDADVRSDAAVEGHGRGGGLAVVPVHLSVRAISQARRAGRGRGE